MFGDEAVDKKMEVVWKQLCRVQMYSDTSGYFLIKYILGIN